MPSSTTLYTSPGNAGNVASQNFTTLYSGSGSINPTQPYGNANVVGLLAASTDGANTIGVISATGNIITDAFFIGDGGLLSNIAGGNIVGNVLNAQFVTNPAQANITSVGVLTSLSSTGNVTASYVIGNGSLLSNITGANVTGTVANAAFATAAGSATTAVTVTGNAQANITSVGTLSGLSVSGNTASGNLLTTGQVTATGNITGNYILGNGSQLTGLPATYGNANVTALLSNLGANSISTTGNVTAANFFGNVVGNIIGNVVVPGSNTAVLINDSGNIGTGAGFTFNTAGNLLTVPGPVSAVGNVTGNYILGNGSQLTGLPATYGNANVVSLLAAFGSNSISTTGNVDAGNVLIGDLLGAGNVTATGNVTGAYILGNGSLLSNITGANVTGTVANATFAVSSGSATTAATVTGNAQANITSVGTLTSLSVTGNTTTGNLLTGGIVSAVGNVTGNYFIGNGSQLTGLPATYGNADVVSLLAAFGSNSISTTGNVTASYVIGNGSLLSNITGANVTGTVANATFAVSSGSATTAITVTGNAQANITSVGTLTSLSVTGTVSSGNVVNTGTISSTGNITAPNFIGNIIGNVDAGGSNTQIQFNNNDILAGNVAMTFDTVTGNIGMGNLIIGSSVTGAANVGGQAQRINTAVPYTGLLSTATAFGNGQILIGNGYFGNLNVGLSLATSPRAAKVYVWDSANIADPTNVGIRYTGISATPYMQLTGNISNTNSVLNGMNTLVAVGGGPSGNTWTNATNSLAIQGASGAVFVGQSNPSIALGNTQITSATGFSGRVLVFSNSTANTAMGVNTGVFLGGGNIGNAIAVAAQFNGASGNITARTYGYYMPPSTTTGANIVGMTTANVFRSAGEYYFLRNDDAVAQSQLGSLRSYNEFNYVNTATSGALTIDKNNAQVQQINLAGNITSVTYANMVSSLSDGTNTDEEADTVTLIFNQGATGGYSVTFPTGSTYKYAGNIRTIGTTANSVSMVSVTVVRLSGTATYLTTVSPEFV